MFEYKAFQVEHPRLKINDYKLTGDDLMARAIQVQNIREQFNVKARIFEDAAELDMEQDFDSRTKIGMKYSTKSRSKDGLTEGDRRII